MNVLSLEWLRTVGGCIVVGIKGGGAHSKEWMIKTQEFIERVFSLPNNRGVKCPCSKCRNSVCEDKTTLALHLCKVGFMPGYEVWTQFLRRRDSVAEKTRSTDMALMGMCARLNAW